MILWLRSSGGAPLGISSTANGISCPLRSAWKVQEGFIPMCSVLGALRVTPLFVCEGTDGGHFGKSLPYYSMAPYSVNVHILNKHLLGTF